MAETTIHHILDELAGAATDNRDKGGKFERLIKAYFLADPLYVSRFSDVWLWNEWPDRKGKADTGIDLVAKERDTGALVAIQCKFYAPSYTLQKGDIDSFFTASGKSPFASRLIVSTTDKWSKHAEDALEAQQIPCARLRVADLEDSAVDWSKFSLAKPDHVVLRTKKKPFKHQQAALKAVRDGFQKHERGKLIMACGTGKTLTSLKIVEQETPSDGLVLFLVPSISLLSQTLKEWTAQATNEIRAFAVCSDTKVGRHSEDIAVHDLAFPATTDAKRLGHALAARPKGDTRRTVIFSTYQSIDVISQAQKKHGVGEFDLIVCDEAHRTTGVTLVDDDESAFVRVHKNEFLAAKRRLYMTATPKIYADESKTKADEAGAEIASMDDEALFGPEFHRLGFGDAVAQGLLADYKVMVLAVDEKSVTATFQSQLADKNKELNLDDVVKIVGCWNGLSKRLAAVEGDNTAQLDPHPMRRAVAFAKDIKASKHLAQLFPEVVDQYIDGHNDEDLLRCEVEHVDGTYNVLLRNQKLDWLKEDTKGNTCRILSNARCLSEGVDVPALDAVLFLNPRDSVVDVVQSVGRVMRRAEGKEYGYIILPIGVPADLTPEEALKDNKKYKVVWQVLQALRAHDDRFNALVNKIELNKDPGGGKINVIGVGGGKPGTEGEGKGGGQVGQQMGFAFPHLDEWRNAIFAKIVQKVGTRKYLEQWAGRVADIAQRHIDRITLLLTDPESKASKAFDKFLKGLHKNINPSITKEDAIEMLAQHLITKPVFEALFENYKFSQSNPVSVSMDKVLKVLDSQALGKETESLDKFYSDVRMRVQGVDNAAGKQRVITELYDKFFKIAFKKMTDRLGIVYTPVPVVDFIIKSADEALRKEFGQGLADEGVHILDPFTGTGTFLVRLLQSGLIPPEAAKRKFKGELHANEIVLLAYYIAAINIEESYHDLTGGDYTPFEGIVLTDTFQLGEGEGQFEEMLPENSARAKKQKSKKIRVVLGNPPYAEGQDDGNDNNQNLDYPRLDSRIAETYAKHSSSKLKNSLYNSYVRAFRWASDRIGEEGVVAFVTGGGWVDGNSMDGIRASLESEFSSIYLFNLRGNARTSGELRQREAGNVFASGSRSSIAITMLVRKKGHQGAANIYYHDIGDYLSADQKLQEIQRLGSVGGIEWVKLTPNEHHDWINQRSEGYQKLLPLSDEKGGLFTLRSSGVKTNRDAWVYNFDRSIVAKSMGRLIDTYNMEMKKHGAAAKAKGKDAQDYAAAVIEKDPTKIKWTREVIADLVRQREYEFDGACLRTATYRPFVKQWMYFNDRLNNCVYQMPQIFPTEDSENYVIQVTGPGSAKEFSALVHRNVPDLEVVSKGNCYPLYVYDMDGEADLLTEPGGGTGRRDAISDDGLATFRKVYQDDSITKKDIFYYVYGVLHSPEFRKEYALDLRKVLPRIPFAGDFWAFSNGGKALAELHLDYEKVEPYPLVEQSGQLKLDPGADTKVVQMRFAKRGKQEDKSTLIVNSHLTLSGLPQDTQDYIVNGKPAIEWVIERFARDTDRASGIVNDPNTWSDDPAYIVNLIKRVVRVSVETMKIVRGLPPLNERKV